MEARVTIRIKLTDDDDSHDLERVPLTLEELFSAVYSKTGAVNFKVLFRDLPIKSLQDLYTAYLENKDNVLTFLVDEDLTAPGYMASSVDSMFKMKPQTEGKLNISEGLISENDLLKVIDEMTEAAKNRLVTSNAEFMKRRQEVYEVDEERWKQISFEQLAFQERLLMTITGEICAKHGINPQIFQNSCRSHASKPSIQRALEEMAEKTLQAGVELPSDFTKEKLREVMDYICSYLEEYLARHPPTNPADFILIKIREGDEVMKKFGYDENQIATALSTYGIDREPEWEDVRKRLQNVMTKAMGMDPSMMMGGY
ncbi:hypothetical protein SteCoe_30236 [Stentor coeruleus]|uniref:Uncharacterized protein n=1 Tax=Stentor coeruleus TaxID=5963 RepID=A0A1R2B408_9CILI|nr:hypothetical protein SteCoe_30236 [Stentor coeruleus]